MNIHIPLSGYSGYKVTLYKDKYGKYFVRKTSTSQIQNERLFLQFKKHRYLMNHSNRYFNIPSISKSRTIKGLFYYEYEYIQGTTLIHYIEKNPFDKVHKVLKKILLTLQELKSTVHYENHPSIKSFIPSLEEKIITNAKLCNIENKMKRQLLSRLHTIRNHNEKTLCHGDFTFDNIIVDDNEEIWLIDFLELFYPHYWLDIAKLFQDIDGKFYEIKHKIILPQNALLPIKEYLLEGISSFDKEYKSYHYFLLAVSLLRVLPYVTIAEDKKIVYNRLKEFISY